MKRADPSGYYAALGLRPDARAPDVKAAFRRRARVLHPDVAGTGDAEAFHRLTVAYKTLSDPRRRADYDRAALARDPPPPAALPVVRTFRRGLWVAAGGAAVVAGCTALLLTSGAGSDRGYRVSADSRVTVAGPSPQARPAPSLPASALAGPPTHYTLPGAGPAAVWVGDPDHAPSHLGTLSPFTPVRAAGVARDGLQPIALAGGGIGYVATSQLMVGDAHDAERARCAYSAGAPPANGEVLATGRPGPSRVTLVNRAAISAVVSLLGSDGSIAARAYLAAGGTATLTDLSGAPWTERAEFGELWSRACRAFVSGSRVQQSAALIKAGSYVPIDPDLPQ